MVYDCSMFILLLSCGLHSISVSIASQNLSVLSYVGPLFAYPHMGLNKINTNGSVEIFEIIDQQKRVVMALNDLSKEGFNEPSQVAQVVLKRDSL